MSGHTHTHAAACFLMPALAPQQHCSNALEHSQGAVSSAFGSCVCVCM